MYDQDEWRGILVLVHPELEHDPAGRKNEIGIIVNSDFTQDEVIVSFNDNIRDLFTADALLILLPEDEIQLNLSKMDAAGQHNKSLAQVDEFLKCEWDFKALEVARDNKAIQALCLQSLENSLELKRGRGL